jgi:hypothetical protein
MFEAIEPGQADYWDVVQKLRAMGEFVYSRLPDHPEGVSRHEHWREVMEIVHKTRRRKMGRRHLLS